MFKYLNQSHNQLLIVQSPSLGFCLDTNEQVAFINCSNANNQYSHGGYRKSKKSFQNAFKA